MLFMQLLDTLKRLHGFWFIHRDIKPDNFLMGLSAKTNQLYMIDFGLSKRYRKRKTGAHISFETGKSLTGTVRYLSVNAHRGYELSRRDDLEAIGHMILYFFKGWLPW